MSVHLVCSHCGVENRVPEQRLADKPKCGKCGAPLLTAKPFEIDAVPLEQHVAKDGLPLLVDCWAAWCGPCRMMAPQFEAAAGLLGRTVRLAKLDTEAHQQTAAHLGIRSIPTMILFAGGREVARTSGVMDAKSIARWAEQQLD